MPSRCWRWSAPSPDHRDPTGPPSATSSRAEGMTTSRMGTPVGWVPILPGSAGRPPGERGASALVGLVRQAAPIMGRLPDVLAMVLVIAPVVGGV